MVPNKGVIAKKYHQEAKLVLGALSEISGEAASAVETALKETGSYTVQVDEKSFPVDADMVEVKKYTKMLHGRKGVMLGFYTVPMEFHNVMLSWIVYCPL